MSRGRVSKWIMESWETEIEMRSWNVNPSLLQTIGDDAVEALSCTLIHSKINFLWHIKKMASESLNETREFLESYQFIIQYQNSVTY